MEQHNNTAETDLRTAVGGKHLLVSFRDKRPEEQLFIKELGVKQADAALLTFQDEMGLAMLFTGKESDYLDLLTAKSFDAVIEEGNAVNADFFAYCEKRAKRRDQAQERMMPGFRERMLSTAENQLKTLVTHSASSVPGSRP